MKPTDTDIDALVEALREDLPTAGDRERVRARLLSAGVAVAAASQVAGSATVAAASGALATTQGSAGAGGAAAAAASASGSTSIAAAVTKGALLAKVAALPTAVKLGSTAVALATVTALSVAPQPQGAPPRTQAEDAGAVQGHAATPRAQREGPGAKPREPVPAPAVVAQPGKSDEPARSTELRVPRTRPAPVVPPEASPRFAPRAPIEHAPATTRAAVPVDKSALAIEVGLLEDALRSLRAGDLDRASGLLSEHRRRFPAGALASERLRAQQRLQRLRADLVGSSGKGDRL